MHTDLITRFEQGATAPAQSIAGLSQQDLLAFPIPNTWSIQLVIMHLMDSDLIATERMKRTIAMTRPLLMGYDEDSFAKRLPYDKLDAHTACKVFELNRTLTATILRNIPAEAWQRRAVHSESGLKTLQDLVESYCDHLDHHLKFITAKRQALGR